MRSYISMITRKSGRSSEMSKLFLLLLCCLEIWARPEKSNLHPQPRTGAKINEENPETSTEFWNTNALNTLKEHLASLDNRNVAKNVILFLGDGMSVPTLAATRVYMGDENVQLSFEKFPYTGISKTYCVDYQVADSACSATAYLGGIKGNLGTIGVNGKVPYGDCQAMTNTSNHVQSIAQWAQINGKSTGLVTTARVTDASPAGVYGHTALRDWEADTDIIKEKQDPKICADLATQLITGEVGQKLNVIMGGGRKVFLPSDTKDDEGVYGYRSDGVNLIDAWKNAKTKEAKYIWNRDQLLGLNETTDYVLGLFESDDCKYNLQRDEKLDPSLAEMTSAAIQTLSKNPQGYFLFVEGALIDKAHHEDFAHLAIDETVEFSKAVQAAVNLTSKEDTLIVVTADHAHTMTFSGYASRRNDIFGVAGTASDNLSYTTLNYANGKGYKKPNEDGSRHDVTLDDLDDVEYPFPGGVPIESETHGGDDVIIFAQGPWSHLFSGVIEQNVIPHLIGYASCIKQDVVTACDIPSAAADIYPSIAMLIAILIIKNVM